MVSTVNSRDAYLHHLYVKTVHSPSRKQKLELVKARKELGEKATDAANMSVALLHFSEIRKHVAD